MSAAKWEDVAYGLDRIAVPGGWLYRAFGGPDALSQRLCYVPDPTAPHVVAAHAPAVAPVAPPDMRSRHRDAVDAVMADLATPWGER